MGKVKRTKENLNKCICISCPSYSLRCKIKAIPNYAKAKIKGNIQKLNHFEGLFCAFEKSNCISKEKGCICAQCKVHKENKLKKLYFCTKNNGK
ncbi:MAG: DUF2769 domain-containing protein [archaeon]